MKDTFLNRLLDEASAPFRSAGHFAYHFSRGKLSSDCIFRELLRRGVFPRSASFLDLGCGQAVFVSWLLAARRLYEKGTWPADWPEPPLVSNYNGYELMQKDVTRAKQALGKFAPQILITQGDICQVDFGHADVVTILDVLQYINYPAQEDVLRRVGAALPAGGLLVTRIGDADAGLPFHLCNWVDRVVSFVRGHRLPSLYCRRLSDWMDMLRDLGFEVATLPMSEGKPFANVMLLARLPSPN